MSDEKVIHLQPHQRMTTAQALAAAAQREWDDVVIVGFPKGDGELAVMTSAMSRETAPWIAEHFRLHTLGLLD